MIFRNRAAVTLHVKAGWWDGQMERETMRLRSGQE